MTALDRAITTAIADRRRGNPLRVHVQVSLDGDVSRGGVDMTDPGAVDRICAQVSDSQSLELIGLMGVPPAIGTRKRPLSGCNPNTIECSSRSLRRCDFPPVCPMTSRSP
ncbi:alanine racemase, N-terminal domain protein [Mycobacterium ulcerans str. Harvey]|uniref:Alanine racemase, N-terminal domain protein n=1 Tax=Mycobacterium ulcerans str. Harvey TaxID=1299332 RepID=A0ABN0QTE4_MYCUL|nr:alanine racemase, N-terminal domain protein [Mycobacterium ulcerans str. Harvey]